MWFSLSRTHAHIHIYSISKIECSPGVETSVQKKKCTCPCSEWWPEGEFSLYSEFLSDVASVTSSLLTQGVCVCGMQAKMK